MPKFLNSVDITAPSLKIESPGTLEPVLEILSTGDNLVSGVLKFHKQRADNSPENDDVMGVIHFHGEDAGGLEQLYGAIKCTVSEVTDGAEGGKLFLSVASHDGEDQPGLLISDGDAEDEVDVTIANGIASVTTIAGELIAKRRRFDITAFGTNGDGNGDIVYFGTIADTLVAGTIYYYASNGEWTLTDANTADSAKASGLLGVALGTSIPEGILLRGTVTLVDVGGTETVGLPLFLSGDLGKATTTHPAANGDTVRILGYLLNGTNDMAWFNPDNTFIEVTA